MAYSDKFVIIPGVLGNAVANGGTFTVGYPTGTSLASFDSGLAGTGHYLLLDDNDKYSSDDIAVSFGALGVVITNNSGDTWAAGSVVDVFLEQLPGGRNVVLVSFYVSASLYITPQDIYTNLRLGVGGVIEEIYWSSLYVPSVIAPGRVLTIAVTIDGTRVTGGELVLITENIPARGGVVHGTPITARNVLTRESAVTISVVGVTGTYTYTNGMLTLRIRLVDD